MVNRIHHIWTMIKKAKWLVTFCEYCICKNECLHIHYTSSSIDYNVTEIRNNFIHLDTKGKFLDALLGMIWDKVINGHIFWVKEKIQCNFCCITIYMYCWYCFTADSLAPPPPSCNLVFGLVLNPGENIYKGYCLHIGG